MVKFFSPASIGNVGVGFDVLGLAISPIDGSFLGDSISIKASNKFQLINTGLFAHELPIDIKKNIVWKCWKHFCNMMGKKIPISIELEKNMPISSGLGSSACSIVSSTIAMKEFFNISLTQLELLIIMGKLEGEISGSIHYDNVAPCYLGGLQLIINEENNIHQSIPIFKEWIWIVAWPGIKLSTETSRSLLPLKYTKQVCIKHSQHLAGFIHATYTKQPNLAIQLMKDIIAEPYRIKIIPNFFNAKKILIELGALNCGISGSGPTLFAICNNMKSAKKIAQWLTKHYLQNQTGFVHICNVDILGTRKIG
ncbi:homoserine kinase [Buchnera aphidicola (Formosaphis micheliae)]|uniref:homoserine kinase n=1 Tax=Buchnera aphidicola TaxID=9 RepID=UPI0031B863BF